VKAMGRTSRFTKMPARVVLVVLGASLLAPIAAATTAAANDCTVQVTNPGDQVSAASDQVGLQIEATGSAGCKKLSYKAFNLPPRVRISKANGFISGKVGGPGDYPVEIKVRDVTTSSATIDFTWHVTPTIESLSQNYGPAGGGTTVTLKGKFPGVTEVDFGGVPGTNLSVVPFGSTATVTTPPGSGDVPVTVVTPNGTNSLAQPTFHYNAVLLNLLPDHGPTSGGTHVVLKGRNLLGTTDVLFGSTPALGVTVKSDRVIDVIAPPGIAGPTTVSAVGPGGTSDPAANAFTYTP
jgi:hypothetical protein